MHVQKSGRCAELYHELEDELVRSIVRPTQNGEADRRYEPVLQFLAKTLVENSHPTVVYLQTWCPPGAAAGVVQTRELRAYELVSPRDGLVKCLCLSRRRLRRLSYNGGILLEADEPVVLAQDIEFQLPHG
jgi:hypothetical protein